VAVFRCTPVALYQQNNPQTMKSFKQVSYLNRQGLTGPARVHQGRVTTFLDPDFRFYVGLLDGAVGNEQIQEYRAFLLNADPAEPVAPEEPEVYGRGYLAADTPTLPYPYLDASASLLRTGGKRLALQKAYGMADPQMLAFHERAGEWLASAGRRLAEFDPAGAALDAGSSLAYAINNHPVIRQRIAHAIWGILWYLGLLVPFVFFFEKLLFGFTDIRKQLLANGLIFLTVYLLLRLFHPAFQMVRSSLVILLGFIILLLTLLVTLMVGGKFRQNIKDLRRGEGRVEGADVSRSGVIGTAFMLGLNNMRRRKVRTGLTSLTLILITFVMICFTSVSTNLVSQEEPLGRSPWNGIMVRNEQFLPLDGAEINTIREVYGQRYPVAELRWLTATLSLASRTPYVQNTEILLDRDYQIGDVRTTKRAKVNAAVEMPWNEPAFSGIDRCLLTTNGWFPQPPRTRAEKLAAQQAGAKTVSYAILPDAVARELGITPDAVHATNLVISIRGEDYTVLGILDSVAVNRLTGLDNKPLLPYDLNSVQNFGVVGWRRVVPEDVGRLPASQVLFVNKLPAPSTGYEEVAAVSCSILFPKEPYRLRPDQPEQPGADYRTQRAVIAEFLERGGQSVYYAADGISYFGSRKRARTLAGLLELLVPILLAALTVFNTMRGSVYERKDEIYVYNAVGIAPNHVFFIFMAEALVYAVVGALLGYLLSQATGRALTALHLTGGMNMEYSSLETIYASLAIMGAVLLSTLLPARDAARLASPTDSPPVQVPRTDQDLVEFALPFTFTPHDRVAVVSYFHRWLDANGSGSSGPFFCAPPKVRLEEVPAEAAGGLVPAVTSTVWLKPYDLGVSQRLEIALPTDPETGEYVARIRIERLSGHVASWQRTLRPFLQVVRKQFLNWRVTTTADRREMFAEAKRLLRQAGRNR
jgi:cell division protein FtsX